jgi:FKBP-type peptidyl-prolyl cis-trans isomerase SlyD
MQIAHNTVVSISYELSDADGNTLEQSDHPVIYLHGGYYGIFPAVEAALEGKRAGEGCQVTLAPEDAFGEYNAELVRVEERHLFPQDVAVGTQFEGGAEDSDEVQVYTVTELTEDKVVVDGNHPLAGQVLQFQCQVEQVRSATEEEITHGHAHGAQGHPH